MLLYLLLFLWFLRTARQILFWLYLWQLKEYHIGRFLDHFRTAKGQQIFFNPLMGLKVLLLAWFFLFPTLSPAVLLLFYVVESGKTLLDFSRGTVKRPIFTSKMIFLCCAAAAAAVVAAAAAFLLFENQLSFFAVSLLIFDIFVPFGVVAIVLSFQPLAVLKRKQIIEKAKKKRTSFQNLLVIGITGSYGKTSIKEFITTILSEKFQVLKTKEHQNSEVGVAQCILNDLKPEHEVFVCEMGAYGRRGIKLLCDIAKPKIGILTGINEQHMATFGSQENIIKTKFELIEALPEDGVAILNGDNRHISNLKSPSSVRASAGKPISNLHLKSKKFYSVKEKLDIWAENIRVEKEYVTFTAFSKDGDRADFKINIYGHHNVPNLLAVAATAKELGMTMADIAKAAEKIEPRQSGMQIKKNINCATIIDATYSANPDGVIAHLEYLKLWQGKKIIIMPCLIELGKASKEVHQRIGRKIGEVCDPVKGPEGPRGAFSGLAIITTKERFNDIKSGAIAAGMKEENILFLEKPKDILGKIKAFSGTDDVLLLEGRISKGITDPLLFPSGK